MKTVNLAVKIQSSRNLARRVWRKLDRNPLPFLQHVSGVVHIGANTGQERGLYHRFGIRVIWIEPIPRIFDKLLVNLRSYPEQRAIQCLITDRDDEERRFHVANNDGQSSSILDLQGHKDIWPSISYMETIILKTMTLTSLFKREGIVPSDYQALIIDTQGSELLVLQGSVPLLGGFKFIKTEVADFESYAGCCQLADIEDFMKEHGYTEISRDKFASGAREDNYFDIVYERQA